MKTPAEEGEQTAKAQQAFTDALSNAADALLKVDRLWQEEMVTNYPVYLPSFDEFAHDFMGMTEEQGPSGFVGGEDAETRANTLEQIKEHVGALEELGVPFNVLQPLYTFLGREQAHGNRQAS